MIDSIAFFVFVIGVIIAVVLSLSGKINVSLMVLVPLLPLTNVLYRFHRYPLGKDFMDIVLVSMLAGWFLKSRSDGEKVFEPTLLNRVVSLMLVYSFISLLWGSFYLHEPFPLTSANVRTQTWKNYIVMPLLYFITVNNVKNIRQMKLLLLFMFLGMFLVDFYTVRQIRLTPSLVSRDKIVGTFMFLGPNHVAAFYVECLLLLVGLFIARKEKLPRLSYAGLIGLGGFIVLFLYSRGAYLGLIAGLIVLAFLKKKALIFPLVAVLVLWQAVLPQNVIERIRETRGTTGELDSSSQHRIEIWKESFSLFLANPVGGIGFDVIYQRGLLKIYKDTHNIYVKILAEQGLIGIVLFLMFLWLSYKSGYLLYRYAEDHFLQGMGLGFAAGVVGMAVTNFFGDRWMFLQVGSYFWVFLGLVSRGLVIVERGEAA